MRKLFVILCMLFVLGLNACQCSDKPEIGPIQEASVVVSNPTAASPST